MPPPEGIPAINFEYVFQQMFDAIFGAGSFVYKVTGGTYFIPEIQAIFAVLSVISIAVIFYAMIRIREIGQIEASKYHFAEPVLRDGIQHNEQWEVVEKHINSTNPSDWRLAILEADNMLEDMVHTMGYEGESLGEKMKAIEPSDFTTIQSAWDAHKIRNQIAHEGSKFQLTEREARRIIGLYKNVFNEFEYI